MLKVAVLALFLAAVSCVDVVEVSGRNVVPTSARSLPVRAVSGVAVNNVRQVLPVGQTVVGGISPLVSTYGVQGYTGLNQNLNYLRDLRARVFGSSVFGNSINIAPSTLGQSLLAIRQPSAAFIQQPAAISFAQPAVSVAQVAQPIAQVAYAQPSIAISQPSIAVARPQVLNVAAQHSAVHPVNAAINQVARTVEYRPIPYQDQPIVPQEVVVEPSDQPINIHFRSRSSTVRISAEHIPGEPGEIVQTQSQDEPSRVQHEVVKPVVQEVKEVIQPYRQVIQEIQPVVENVHTVVSEGQGQRAQYVAEPIRQQVLSVQPAVQQFAVRPAVQQLAVQQLAVPAVRQIQVQQPHYVAVSQPAIQTVGVQHVVPQYQSLSVAQPFVSSYVAQPQLAFGSVRSVGIAQPVVGVNRVVSVQQPSAVVRTEEVREVQPNIEVRQQGSNFVRYAEADD